jgi:streptogramin lyase
MMPLTAVAITITGTVRAIDGSPMPNVMVTAHNKMPIQATPGAATLSVFTTSDGQFRMPDLPYAHSNDVLLSIKKVGVIQTAIDLKYPTPEAIQATITVQPIDNVAEQVPPSAWLADFPTDDRGARTVVGNCAGSGCHQFPADRVKKFAKSLADTVAEHPNSSEAMGYQVWLGMVQYMRNMSLRFSAETNLRWGLNDKAATEFSSPKNALFNESEGEMIAKTLSKALTSEKFDKYPLDKYKKISHGDIGVNDKTVIREYQLLTDGWTREASRSSSTPYTWFVEDNKSRIGQLDIDTGHVRWIPVPSNVKGPHTINADKDGNFWISLEESFDVGYFDPKAEKWTTYSGFGKGALVHDFCMDEHRQVRYDKSGGLWLTLLGSNKLARLDTKTKRIVSYPMPLPPKESVFHTALYGCVMTSDMTHAWFTQLSSSIGAFNMKTGKVDAYYEFPIGTIPHRMAIDDKDVVYVALSGDGQIWSLDTRVPGAKPKLYNLPDRNSAPYSVTWDNRRKVLWVATSNNDIIYKLDPATGAFAEFPLPRKGAFLRMIDVDPKTGDLWTTYSNLPVGQGPNFIVQLTPGD